MLNIMELVLKGVTKRYDNVPAINGVSFKVSKGKIIGIIGPNGAGKSTLLKGIAGLHQFDEGRISWQNIRDLRENDGDLREKEIRVFEDGRYYWEIVDLMKNKRWRDEHTTFCPQIPVGYSLLTAWENINTMATLYNVRNNERVIELVRLFNLQHILNKKMGKLSGGERQKVSLVMNLLPDLNILMLDEPSTGLDVESRHRLWKYLKTRKKDCIILITSHDFEEITGICDEIVILNEGVIITSGNPAEILTKHAPYDFALEITTLDHARVSKELELDFISLNDNTLIIPAPTSEYIHDLQSKLIPLQEAGIVTSCLTRRTTLEDVFVNLTGRQIKNKNEMKNSTSIPKSNPSPSKSYRNLSRGHFKSFNVLFQKSVKSFFRNKGLFLITIITPLILCGCFYFAFRNPNDQFTLGFYNDDYDGAAYLGHVETLGSMFFLQGLDKATDGTNKIFDLESFNDYNEGLTKCNDGKLNGFIVIPQNFSECLIGSTWWYRDLVESGFENVEEIVYELEAYFQSYIEEMGLEFDGDDLDVEQIIDELTVSEFPTNSTPVIELVVDPNRMTRLSMSVSIDEVLDQIIMLTNELQASEIIVKNWNDAKENEMIDLLDSFLPAFAIMVSILPLVGTGIIIVHEKEEGTLEMIERSPSSWVSSLSSIVLSELVVYSGVCLVMVGAVRLFGSYSHPNCSWGLFYLNLFLLVPSSIGFGLIIGTFINEIGTAISTSLVVVIALSLLGGMFIPMVGGVSEFIPAYYALLTSGNLVLSGISFSAISMNFFILGISGIVLIITGFGLFYIRLWGNYN